MRVNGAPLAWARGHGLRTCRPAVGARDYGWIDVAVSLVRDVYHATTMPA